MGLPEFRVKLRAALRRLKEGLPILHSMGGMHRRNRLTIMVRMSRLARITEAAWRNVAPGLITVSILTGLARLARTSRPPRQNRDYAY